MVLGKGLKDYHEQGFRSFHTPGHKGRQEFFHGLKLPADDLTELPGLDMLHAPRGIIAQAQQRVAEIFGADESFFLINGATAGNQAMFMALGDGGGKPVLVGRQAHRSVMAGLVLSGIRPQYVMPVIHPDFNLPLGADITRYAASRQDISACHVTYPGYYGTTVDLGQIIAQKNRLNAAQPVLVDQAHGSHYLSELFPASALELGADLVLHSTHKTLSALTQSAILHVQGTTIDRIKLRQCLEMLQSSSPSYLLLASLERAGEFALEKERWEELREEVEQLYHKAGSLLRILTAKDAGSYGIDQVDWSKILVNTRPLGIPAPVCVEHLRRNYGIEPELWDQENILFLLGIGNQPEDIQLLAQGLESLSQLATRLGKKLRTLYKTNPVPENAGNTSGCSDSIVYNEPKELNAILPPQRLTPREAFLAPKRQVPLAESLGQIAAETISPYPPGVPLLVMGEEITPEIAEVLEAGRSGRWQGWDGAETGLIRVIE